MIRAWAIAALLAAAPASAQLELRGSVVQGHVLFGRTAQGARVRFDGRSIRVSPSGAFVIGIAPDREGRASLRAELPNGRRVLRDLEIAVRDYPERRMPGLRAMQDRAFDARLERVLRRDGSTPWFERGFEIPVRGAITSPFGVRRMLDGGPSRHWGVDIASARGRPVRAPGDGVIVLDGAGAIFGRTIVIDHGHGLTSSLLHLSDVRARVGDRVRRGDVVASSGASGRVTGPHLDWRMQLFGVPLDPLSALN